MSLVVHEITSGSGRYYLYDHVRVGKKLETHYVGVADVKVVSHIPAKGYPVESECYKEGHQEGIKSEKNEYGEEKYKELNQHINKVIPEGELAGSHTEKGDILVHKNIDPKYREQVITHEANEHEYMEEQKCKAKGAKPRTEKQSNRRIEAALRHPDKLGAGAKRRRDLNLTKEEHIKVVMLEYERGTLHSSSGKLVTSKKQALAIAYLEIKSKEN
jgi:hypothetical protein